MERKRIDLAGSATTGGTKTSRSDRSDGPFSNPKNIVMVTVAGLAIIGAGYLFYANFFATAGAPQEAASPQVDATFQAAAEAPPPDPNVQFEPGAGKRPN